MTDHRRSKSKKNARTVKGCIEELDRRASFVERDIRDKATDPLFPRAVLDAMRSEAAAEREAIRRLSQPDLPETPPFDPEPVHRDEWRQARQWSSDRQLSLLCGTLARLVEAEPAMVAAVREAFRGAHYAVRNAQRESPGDGPEDVPCETSAPPPGTSARR